MPRRYFRLVAAGLGHGEVRLMRESTRRTDIMLLLAARSLRSFGDGFAVIILPVYLSAIGLTTPEIGIVAAASLLGSAALTMAVGFVAPRHALRTLLIAGAILAVLT